MTTKLLIRKKRVNAKGETAILVGYYHDHKHCLFSTGIYVKPKDWDETGQKIKRSMKGFSTRNSVLNQLKADIDEIALELKFQGVVPTTEQVKKAHNSKVGKGEIEQKTFMDYFDSFVEENRPQKAHGTIQKYITLQNHLKDFQEFHSTQLSFDVINNSFYNSFINFLYDQKELSDNTVGDMIKNLKVFLNDMSDKGLNSNLDFQKFVRPKAPATPFVLSEKELNHIVAIDLTNKPKLEIVRDLFVLGCFTGLRFGNYSKLTSENIVGNTLKVFPNKGKKAQITIPITDHSRPIIEKYDGNFPTMSDVLMNRGLKELGQLVGLDDEVERVRYAGKNKTTFKKKKWELLVTHTARRVFITHSLNKGMRPDIIMKITGHTDIKTMMRYVGVNQEEVNAEMMDAWGK
ncbi:site-specific integrase [Sediminitomix flava]|uniref:Site-specific recombinase XerD n=1 Tax=Sediminitomix flava TaxID=379075 RepID=A0A315ZAU6_SEDFL|nr:site-specific integrase [Sediminitomix flava]PWJ42671.1 site-specific recombinase XerD [Sediminitomix flava]